MSIFSRVVKKPAPIDPKEARPAAEPPVTSKANGVPSPAPRPPGPPATPAPKNHGVSSDKGPFGAAAAATAVAKAPALSTLSPSGAPTPARVVAERPSAPPAPKPVAAREPQSDSIDLVIEMALEASASEEEAPAILPGTSTASDLAAVRATFEDLAVPYMAEVRGVMMELQGQDVQSSWFELTRPLLRSLRKMAEPVGHTPLVEALDRFDEAVAEVLAPGQPATPSPAAREALLDAYNPLRTCLPPAFELEGERDRREPLIVRALLEQVQGLEPIVLEALVAAGFGKLSALYAARADEIAAVTGIGDVVAAAIANRIQAFRRATPAALASVDRTATVNELGRLLDTLRTQHAAYDAVTRGWSDQDQSAKRQVRRARQHTLLQITIELVRLGEVAVVQRLDRLPFAKKVDEVERFIGQAFQAERAKSRTAPPPATAAVAAIAT